MKSIRIAAVALLAACALTLSGCCAEKALLLRNPFQLPDLAPQNALPRPTTAVFAAPIGQPQLQLQAVAPQSYGACPAPVVDPEPVFSARAPRYTREK